MYSTNELSITFINGSLFMEVEYLNNNIFLIVI